jgi:hypothetical protein
MSSRRKFFGGRRSILCCLLVYVVFVFSPWTDDYFVLPTVLLRKGAQEDIWKSISSLSVDNLSTVSCPTLLHNPSMTQSFDPNKGFYRIPKTRTTNPFKVSVNVTPKRIWSDPSTWFWSSAKAHYGENVVLERRVESILQEEASSGSHNVIQITDGDESFYYYTLLARSMKRDVVVDSFFDSNLVQVLRLCESLQVNRWVAGGQVRIHPLWMRDDSQQHAGNTPDYSNLTP